MSSLDKLNECLNTYIPLRLSVKNHTYFLKMLAIGSGVMILIWLGIFMILEPSESWEKSKVALGVVLLYLVGWTTNRSYLILSYDNSTSKRDPITRPLLVTLLAASLYFIVMSWITVVRHRLFHSSGFDLAIQENILWNTLNGRFFHSSVMNDIPYLGNHVVIIYLLLLPLYKLLPYTETLLIFQSLLLAAGSIPLFFVSYHLCKRAWLSSLLACSYLLHPALQGGNYYDFHELSFLPLLYLCGVWGWLSSRRIFMWGSFLLLVFVKEDCGIPICLFGLFLICDGFIRDGLKLVIVSLCAFYLSQNIIIPFFSGHASSYAWYFATAVPDSSSPLAVLKSIWSSPIESAFRLWNNSRRDYFTLLFLPVIFLPLLTFRTVIPLIYSFGLLLFSSHWPLYSPGFHYSFHIVPAIYLGTALVVAHLKKRIVQNIACSLIGVASLSMYVLNGTPFPLESFQGGFESFHGGIKIPLTYWGDERQLALSRDVSAALDILPTDASILASENLVPHFARRAKIVGDRSYDFANDRGYSYCIKFRNSPSTQEADACSQHGCWGKELVRFSTILICKR